MPVETILSTHAHTHTHTNTHTQTHTHTHTHTHTVDLHLDACAFRWIDLGSTTEAMIAVLGNRAGAVSFYRVSVNGQ